MTASHKILAWVEEVTVCDCCGKSDLSGTFACETEAGDVIHYGSTCARRNTGIKNPASAAAAYLRERQDAARTAARQTVEYRALRARFAERDRAGVEPGRGAAEFVSDASNAFDVVAHNLAAQFRVPFSVVRCA